MTSLNVTLRTRSRKIDTAAIVAQRLKRLSSIETKLKRFTKMKLSQMQDLGGCRAVLKDVAAVDAVVKLYSSSTGKNRTKRHEFVSSDDYIRNPKLDGYRSYHLVYRYRSESKKHSLYNGLKIEIQIRSRLQHAWATAVETVSTFTGQALKFSGGEEAWRRFFALMGSAIALEEATPLVPGTPESPTALVSELRALTSDLKVEAVLGAWGSALKQLPPKKGTDAKAFLLYLDATAGTLDINSYSADELQVASDDYLAAEKKAEKVPGAQAVLVSVDSLAALRSAYPNYFLDTRIFLQALRRAIRRTA